MPLSSYSTCHPLCLYKIYHQADCIRLDQGCLQPCPIDSREVQTASWCSWHNCNLPSGYIHSRGIRRQHKSKSCSKSVWLACVHFSLLCYFSGSKGHSVADCDCWNACTIPSGALCSSDASRSRLPIIPNASLGILTTNTVRHIQLHRISCQVPPWLRR